MALTADVKIVRLGTPGNASQPVNLPQGGNTTIFRGSIATTRAGFLVPASAPQSTDIVWGLIEKAGPGQADIGPGIVGGTTNGATNIEVATGSFWLSAGTGADAIAAANIGATVFVINETTVGLTNGSNTRPVAGIVEAVSDPLNVLKGLVAIKMGNSQSTGAPQ